MHMVLHGNILNAYYYSTNLTHFAPNLNVRAFSFNVGQQHFRMDARGSIQYLINVTISAMLTVRFPLPPTHNETFVPYRCKHGSRTAECMLETAPVRIARLANAAYRWGFGLDDVLLMPRKSTCLAASYRRCDTSSCPHPWYAAACVSHATTAASKHCLAFFKFPSCIQTSHGSTLLLTKMNQNNSRRLPAATLWTFHGGCRVFASSGIHSRKLGGRASNSDSCSSAR